MLTAKALKADISADADDRPFKTAAGVRFLEFYGVTDPDLDRHVNSPERTGRGSFDGPFRRRLYARHQQSQVLSKRKVSDGKS